MRSSWFSRTLLIAVGAAMIGVSVAAAKPGPAPGRRRTLNLFAAGGLFFQVNRQGCGITNNGQECVAFAGSPVGGGGFWPKGTPDQYIFNSGLQIVGIVDPVAVFGGPGATWAADTGGFFFFNASGGEGGEGLELVYDRLNPADVAAWPNGAIVRDADIYNSDLLGLPAVSQGDAWTRYWEGDPALSAGRNHPLGIVVDQRALAWNYPSGNEDIIYFIFTFYNVTARKASGVYANPTIPPEVQNEIGDIGDQFQNRNEQVFKVGIPDAGYTIRNVYAAFSMDADVANFNANYASAILPFQIGLTYSGDWLGDPGWVFPPDIFGDPFFPAPGFIGVKYLKAPSPLGLTMFSQTYNPNFGSGLRDANDVKQLYRYLSGFFGAGDVPCSVGSAATARALRLCFLGQLQGDARFYQSSGPFDLAPGEARSIVVAYINAAPLKAPVLPFVGGDLPPAVPPSGAALAAGDTVRTLDRVAGWVSHADNDADNVIEQNEVTTTPRSLLAKALTAQEVFDNGFLLPFSPDAPGFFLVPGDDQVTVMWQRSPTEAAGDPYYRVASVPFDALGNPTALYDPNFRQNDVEGYRIYRGRTSSALELVAQFDYGGSTLTDYTGTFDYGAGCAPELGVQTGCPIVFDTIRPNTTDSVPHAIQGLVIQVKPGDRTTLSNGNVFTLKSDTAVIGGASGLPALTDGGVPFVYVDRGVRNSFTYFYAVTAFDVNSYVSGPSSLESPRVTKRVTPRANSGQESAGQLAAMQFIGADGNVVAVGPIPAINAATGIFAGPMPPADGITVGLAAFLPQLLGASGSLEVTIDSVVPGMAELDVMPGRFRPTLYYFTGVGAATPVKFVVALEQHQHEEDRSAGTAFEATSIDSAKASRFGGDQTYSLYGQASLSTSGTWLLASWGRGSINGVPANSDFNGPRWWAGAANENTNDPSGGNCVGSPGACGNTVPVPNIALTAGAIAGVSIFHPQSYNSVPNAPMRNLEPLLATVTRAADFRVHWGAAGAVDSVVDVTHRVPVPFNSKIRASWGILNQASFASTTAALTRDANNALLTWSDIFCVDPVTTTMSSTANGDCGGAAQTPAVFQNTAALSPIAFSSSSYANTATLTANGNGFIFYIAGHYFLMRTAALPAAGEVWNLRTYAGSVTGSAAGGDFAFIPAIRPPAVPGARLRVTFQGSTIDPTLATDLSLVHTVPDPYYVANSLEFTANQKILKFVNLPSQAIIRIYSVSGVLVNVIAHNDITAGGEATWNLRNRNNQFVASGVYFYHVETPAGQKKVGRLTVVNFAP